VENDMKKIPVFKTDKEAAEFWEKHSFEDYYKDTKAAEIRFVKKPKKSITIRLDPEDIKSVIQIADQKGLSYTSLLRMWIKDHLVKEARKIA
jgi:predicted DNA binding CopG/RHH family protein